MEVSSYVINLKRTPDRLERFRANNSRTNISFEVFEATEGNEISETMRDEIVRHEAHFTSGALGAAASHRRLWQRCSDQCNPFVICEDDALMREDLSEQLPMICRGDWDIIMLGYNFDSALEIEVAPGILLGGGFSVQFPNQQHLKDFVRNRAHVATHRLNFSLGICAYVISPSGARCLLQKAFPMDNRPTIVRSNARSFPAFGIDCVMATLYPELSAYACIAPLAMSPNNQGASLTRRK